MLAEFAAKHRITYPLLSDEGSHIIRALGLYNEHLEAQARFYGRDPRPDQYGVPYPGIFRLDAQGVIMDKQFEQSYRVRPSPAVLLAILSPAPAGLVGEQQIERDGIAIRMGLDAADYRPYEQHELRVTVQMAPGLHIYGAPVPLQLTPLEITIAPFEGLEVGATRLPPPRPFRGAGLDDELPVYERTIMAVVRFHIVPYQETATLAVQVAYQACTDRECYSPDAVSVELTLKGVDLLRD